MRKAAVAAGGFAVAVAVSGCAGTTSGQAVPVFDNTQQLVRMASAQTSDAKSSKFNMTVSVAGQKIIANGAARYAGSDSAMSMTMDVLGQQMEMRLVDEVVYLKPPANSPGAAQLDKPWMKISPDGDDIMSKMMGPMLDQLSEQSDPTKTLEQIQQAGTITKSEHTKLDGKPATRYWIDIDFAKATKMQASSGLPQQMLEQMRGAFDGLVLPMQLWLNDEQLPVKISMDMTPVAQAVAEHLGQPQAAQGMGGMMTMTYTDWGAPVEVQAPPANQVGEPPEMTKNMPGMPKMPN